VRQGASVRVTSRIARRRSASGVVGRRGAARLELVDELPEQREQEIAARREVPILGEGLGPGGLVTT
jgi:hypothetical protein